MKIKPLITEKSLARSKLGKYSFVVPIDSSSGQIRRTLEENFSVKVKKIWTLKKAAENYTSRTRKSMVKPARKLAIITLKEGKIDIFESMGESAKEEKVKELKNSGGNKK